LCCERDITMPIRKATASHRLRVAARSVIAASPREILDAAAEQGDGVQGSGKAFDNDGRQQPVRTA